VRFILCLSCAWALGLAQSTEPDPAVAPATPPTFQQDKHAYAVLPNYRTAEGSVPFQPISTQKKFVLATEDSFDYGVWITTGFFAGLSQISGSGNEIYGQGVKGFAYRYGVNYADQIIGNYFPEAIVPMLFHTDPRYFRKGEGSKWSRVEHAVGFIFVCKSDSGRTVFNVNEFVGNAMAASVAISYHTGNRTWGDGVQQMGSFLVSDMIGQVLKEFWPDVKRYFRKDKH